MKNAFSIVLAACVLYGCGSSPPARFYTLDAPAATAAASASASYSVVVGPVTVPDIVDRPQLVVRTGAHQVEIAELARWAEPLRDAIPRVVAAGMQKRLANARVTASTPTLAAAADYRVAIAFDRIEAAPGDSVNVEAVWTIAMKDQTRTGRTIARESCGRDYGDIAAAYSRALDRLSAEIAEALNAGRK
jgi:uncharacterized lipoprotein YmbA